MSRSSGSRDRIFGRIRKAGASTAIGGPSRLSPEPVSGSRIGDLDASIEQFQRYARQEAATVERVKAAAELPARVVDYLQKQCLPKRVILADSIKRDDIDWSSVADLDCATGPVAADGDTVVTGCYAGIAEVGAIVTLSARDHPAEISFLPATHIVVLDARHLVDSFEQLWRRLRADFPGRWPRVMNFIVGPSRTADLGVPSKLGAHGPARVHIIIEAP